MVGSARAPGDAKHVQRLSHERGAIMGSARSSVKFTGSIGLAQRKANPSGNTPNPRGQAGSRRDEVTNLLCALPKVRLCGPVPGKTRCWQKR